MIALDTTRLLVVSGALIVIVPLVTIALGEAIDRLRSAGSAYAPFFEALRSVVLPVIVVFVVARFVFGAQLSGAGEEDAATTPIFYAFVLSTFYLAAAYALILAMRGVRQQKDPAAWENRIPSLFKAIFTGLLFVLPVVFLLQVWGVPIGNAAAFVGVAAAVIGFALQDALSSITKGFLLVIDRPFSVGDWIEVDGIKGQVIDISWRSTRLQVAGRDVVVIPNLIISDNSVYNFTMMDISYRDEVTIGFSYADPPNKVKRVLMEMIEDCPGVMKVPRPEVFTESYDDFSIGYRVYFFVEEYVSAMEQDRLRDDIVTRIWYATQRHGLTIPFPINVEGPPAAFEPDHDAIRVGVADFLGSNAYFERLPAGLREALLPQVEIRRFAAGETVFEAGQSADTLLVVREGQFSLLSHAGSDRLEAGRGDVLGEISLMGERGHLFTCTALADGEVLAIPASALIDHLEDHPRFARALNRVIETRLNALQGAA